MTNREKFQAALLKVFQETMFISYPLEKLAAEFADGLTMTPPRTLNSGPCVKAACKECGIENTYKAIREYCAE